MAQYDYLSPTLVQLRKLIQKLKLADETLSSRFDAQVSASTDSDADYAAEVIDSRVDFWANIHASSGSNIRNGQQRFSDILTNMQTLLQNQIDELSNSKINDTLNIAEANEKRRQDLAFEENARINDDDSLQRQINELSYAVLNLIVLISQK